MGLPGILVIVALVGAQANNCFVPQKQPEAPFTDDAIAEMRTHFLGNLNYHGKGAVLASPGEIPAFNGCCPGGYRYHWTRDSALAMSLLYKLAGSKIGSVGNFPNGQTVTKELLAKIFRAYVDWEGKLSESNASVGNAEPKWDIQTEGPYESNWCRPQTDGPALRARTLALYAIGDLMHGQPGRLTTIKRLWKMVKYDLDWLAHSKNINMSACDLWEETRDSGFLWNEVVQRAGLLQGVRLASIMGDADRSKRYLEAAQQHLKNPMETHLDHGRAQSCSSDYGSCQLMGKRWDGAVILAFIHSGWLELPLFSETSLKPLSLPTSIHVARTVEQFNRVFCGAYSINRKDSGQNIPGVLYGRYAEDQYGGGNPWVLITGALAALFYQCAQVVTRSVLVADELDAWRKALNWDDFTGVSSEFIAAGDSVMKRLRHHINGDVAGYHLYEQIDKNSGKQWNAEDLTWSYAEVLGALLERNVAMRDMAGGQSLLFT